MAPYISYVFGNVLTLGQVEAVANARTPPPALEKYLKETDQARIGARLGDRQSSSTIQGVRQADKSMDQRCYTLFQWEAAKLSSAAL